MVASSYSTVQLVQLRLLLVMGIVRHLHARLMMSHIQSYVTGYDSGALNSPQNPHYAIFFGKGVTITSPSGTSCQAFCGYHSTIAKGSGFVTYSVYPTGCETCGTFPSAIQSIISHEFAETITDAAVGLNQLGWYDSENGEIGDICAWQDSLTMAANENSYTVQKMWSNSQNACVAS